MLSADSQTSRITITTNGHTISSSRLLTGRKLMSFCSEAIVDAVSDPVL